MVLEHHLFSLRQLQYAVAIAQARSFRKAAELCHVSQPSLSAQLAQLEDALGVRLFERDKKRVLLTSAGEDIIARAKRILLASDDLVVAAKHHGDPLAETLRVGLIPTVAPYLLPEIVPALREHYPRLQLQWVEEKTETLLASLRAGQLDAAVVALEAKLGEFERILLMHDPFVLALPKAHPLAKGTRSITPGVLEGVRVLLLEEGHCLREQALAVCQREKADELDFRATSLPTLAQMVASGAGITLLPRLAVPVEAHRAELTLRKFGNEAPSRTLVLVFRPQSPRGPGLRQVAATVRKQCERIEPELERTLLAHLRAPKRKRSA